MSTLFAFYFKHDLMQKVPNYAVRMFSNKLNQTVIDDFCSKMDCAPDKVVVKVLERDVVYTHKSLDNVEDVTGEVPCTGDNLPLYTLSVSMYNIPTKTFLSFTSSVSHDKESLIQIAKKLGMKNSVVEIFCDVHKVNYGDIFDESIVLDGQEIFSTSD